MRIGIAGTGPAALMAGSQLILQGHQVTFFEHKKAAGRKFLVAGHGGFNLSHSEPEEVFLSRYSHEEIKRCVRRFDNQQLVSWLQFIGIETYQGSTGKIFPVKGIKPIQVLKSWLDWLESKGTIFLYEHKMMDFTNESLLIENQQTQQWIHFDKIILALGGGSWSKTGSDAAWTTLFKSKSIEIVPLQASNAGMNFDFKQLPSELEGSIAKNVVVSHNEIQRAGEITFTAYGFEGSPIYFLNGSFRENPALPVYIDFKPQFTTDAVLETLQTSKNATEGLKKLKLAKAAIWLLKSELTKEEFIQPQILSQKIKSFAVQIHSLRPIEEAISTSGGVSWSEIDEDLSLKKFPNVSVCGEMLDWDAPTGGYLLQACFAGGYCAGMGRNYKLEDDELRIS